MKPIFSIPGRHLWGNVVLNVALNVGVSVVLNVVDETPHRDECRRWDI
jgi:hypothetical protein